MSRQSLIVVCLAMLLCAGCRHHLGGIASNKSVDQASTNGFDAFSALPADRAAESSGLPRVHNATVLYGQPVFAAGRFVAVRHKLELIEPDSNLPKSVDAVINFCATIRCEILSSNVTNETSVLSPSATITARVAPQDLGKFLDFIGKQGKVAQHATESEDKTAAVIDIEAKIKNQADFRDSLRRMLTRPGTSVSDLLQIQEKLADAQSELDSEATQRKVLANETEKVAVEIEFRSEQRTIHRGAFASVGEAFRNFVSVLSDSLAALIYAIAAIVPWLIIIVPAIWALARVVRKLRRKRAERRAATLADSHS